MNFKTKIFAAVCGLSLLSIAACFATNDHTTAEGKQLAIPLAGNAYLTSGPQTEGITGNGIEKWRSAANVYSVFFKLENAANVKVGVRAQAASGKSTIQFSTGNSTQNVTISDTSFDEITVGTFELSKGYFGIQVNSPGERRVLFSVWSPYKTDDPNEIPESQRIKLLKKGEGVHAGKFGNEGSGGQSYWKFNWEAGQTYRFLTQVKPDGNGNTAYTSYFYVSKLGKWKLIAGFLRPRTDTWVSGPHSFLENFADTQGYKTRKAMYGNQWVRDAGGQWHELTEATFSGDDIASIGFRKDYKSGTMGQAFYLQNGGFFDENISLGTHLKRKATNEFPQINFTGLP